MFSVVEKFVSINGEGLRAGELAAFIRFKGCNLNCSYCDTLWANVSDAPCVHESTGELAKWVRGTGVINVTLTGGEPLLQNGIEELTDLLLEQGNRVEIETNGSIPLDKLASQTRRPVFTMDYKLPSSGMERFMLIENFRLLNREDSVKFVIGSTEDLIRAHEIIEKHLQNAVCGIFFSPVFGQTEPSLMVEYMKEHRLNQVRLQLQLHKFIWDPDKRGV